jgi:hypothetical protein
MPVTTLETLGDWDTTTLYQDRGQGKMEISASRFYLRLRAGRDEEGEIVGGGIALGGDMEGHIVPLDESGEPADHQLGLFPGRVEMRLLTERLVVENDHPDLVWSATRVWINEQERTSDIVDVLVEIDYPEDLQMATYAVYKRRLLGTDEVRTRKIMGV